ncbi:MAG TPA: calcium/sodium antiporter [Desulfatiglandales bacterium]|nr:calcium/sodium antiporter [Desulfatiglandales bacterium]
MITLDLLFCIIGFMLLYYGAEWLVKGSSSIARSLGVTPVVIGLTVVAFGTSTPEFVVSIVSSIKGNSMIAVGNVIGSNIFNISFILGISALFRPITSSRSVVKRNIPIMLGVSLFILLISLDSMLGRLEGAILFAGIILYTFFNYYMARKESRQGQENFTGQIKSEFDEIGYITSRSRQIVLIVAGIAGVVAGAQIVVDSAVKIMEMLGVSEKFIGLTIVAVGTSLPELATSVVAAMKKEMDISIGNLVGSNVFNILSVLGAASLIRPIPVPGGFIESGMIFDYMVMIFTSFLPWLFMRKGLTVNRADGMLLLMCYFGYMAYQVIQAL